MSFGQLVASQRLGGKSDRSCELVGLDAPDKRESEWQTESN